MMASPPGSGSDRHNAAAAVLWPVVPAPCRVARSSPASDGGARVIDDFVVRHANWRDPALRPPRLTTSESRVENWSGFNSPHTIHQEKSCPTSLKRYGQSSTASSAELHRRSSSCSRIESSGTKRRTDRIGLVQRLCEKEAIMANVFARQATGNLPRAYYSTHALSDAGLRSHLRSKRLMGRHPSSR